MRFSLKTLQFAILGFVLALGLPALLPPYMLQGLVWLVEALVTIAFLTRLVYTRGRSQAFALGVTAMGLVLLIGGGQGADSQLLSGLGLGFALYRTLPLIGGLWHILLMFGAGYFARWIYEQLPAEAHP
ncbi:MAG: hypothetical protein U0795_02570 [Pirellulales bacterium]